MTSLGAGCDIGERVAVLVEVDGQSRALPQRDAARVACGQRLLDVLDAECLQLGNRVQRLVERPVLVHVDLQGQRGRAPHRADAFDVEPVPPAELQLEAPEPPVRARLGARAMSSGSPSQIV